MAVHAGCQEAAGANRYVLVAKVHEIGSWPVSEMGMRYEQPTSAPVVSQDQAVAAATARRPGLAELAAQIEARYVLFSDDEHCVSDTSGKMHLAFQRVPAWIITFKGLRVASRGPEPKAFFHEANVAINAQTGEYLETFWYQ